MAFKLRPLSTSDHQFISDLYQDPLIMRHIGLLLTEQQAAGLCEKMLAEVHKQKAVYQVIMTADTEQRVGLLSMHWRAADALIESGMIVLPAFQNQGVCKWAQLTAMDQIKVFFPAKTCAVYITKDNIAANTSYQNMGFVAVENTSESKQHLNLNRWDYNMELLNQ